MHGLVTRQGMDRGLVHPACTGQDPIERLMPIATQLPTLLEQSDVMFVSKTWKQNDLDRLLEDFQRLLSNLNTWLAISRSENSLQSPSEWPAAFCPLRASSHINEKSDGPFPDIFVYASFTQALSYTLYWTCLGLIGESIFDLMTMSSYLPSNKLDNLNAPIQECAKLLCKSIPYLQSAVDGIPCRTMVCRSPLYFSQRWFVRLGMEAEQKWCLDAEASLREDASFLRWDMLLSFGLFMFPWITAG